EPGVGKDIARAICCPARGIHFAMRAHGHLRAVDFAAANAQIADQLLAGFELRARRLIAVEIADETNAEPDVVHVIAVDVAATELVHPAIADLDLAIAR